MTRHKSRENAFIAVFEAGFSANDLEDILAVTQELPEYEDYMLDEFAMNLIKLYYDHADEVNDMIQSKLKGWDQKRISRVCSAILRLSTAEIMYSNEDMDSIIINEAVEICKAEKKSGKVLSIGFQPRFDPNMQMIKKIVESGELGEIYYIQTGGGRRKGIPTPFGTTFIEDKTAGLGALGDIGCYSLDMVLNAIGYPKPLTVTGYTSNFFGTDPNYYETHPEYASLFGVDDFGAGFIRLEGGIILDFRIAWAMHLDTPGDTIIMGKKGSLRIPSTECWNGSVGGPMKIYKNVAGEGVEIEIPIIPDKSEGNFYKKIRSFLDAVKTGGKAPVPTSQIIINQAIIDGIAKSSKLGKEIEIEIPEI